MKRAQLLGVNTLSEPVKFGADVVAFVSSDNYFKITPDRNPEGVIFAVKVTTPKGSYVLTKHPTLNVYAGICGRTKVHISLKKIIGEVRYW
jgi:hypothetical protein